MRYRTLMESGTGMLPPDSATGGILPNVSVVVPVYNGAGSIAELVERTTTVLAARGSAFEFICVNDGSRDGSWDVIERLARKHVGVRGLDLMRNYGQGNVLKGASGAANAHKASAFRVMNEPAYAVRHGNLDDRASYER